MITLPIGDSTLDHPRDPRPPCLLPRLPFEVHFRGGQKLRPTLEASPDGPIYHLQAKTEEEFHAAPFKDWEVLSRTILDDFLAVSTPADGLQFLAATGHFLWDAWSLEDPNYSAILPWAEFVMWQDLVRDIEANGFLAFYLDNKDGNCIVTASHFPQHRLDANRRKLISRTPQSTFDLLNGIQPEILLVERFNPDDVQGPSHLALVTETLTSLDTMLARLYVESCLAL
jgi:hypothetical protein